MGRKVTGLLAVCISILALVFFAGGCGYSFTVSGIQDDAPGRALFVPVVENQTAESGLGVSLADAFLEELVRTRRFRPAGPDDAEFVLEATVRAIQDEGLARRTGGDAFTRRVRLIVDARLLDSSARVVWQETGLSQYEDFVVSQTDMGLTRSARQKALMRLSERLARSVGDRIATRIDAF
ncbi:MAG: LPS assembly lipoprotein LptE [Desulfatibacillaceae bacterium]|nr:LPS assembly lipoprotein LptE [Desulfatibacillaceae bacterium]